MVKGWGSELFLRYKALNEVKTVCLSIRKKNIYGLGVGI